ncbi:MAG: hypothetical protein C4527_10730 [Candidatus Omnitrophota bacterium]|jgi:hypothetical protein|nr:MAG: hypothetical protein C4527_10730 [Candidatus Omnitrophota bacterium]
MQNHNETTTKEIQPEIAEVPYGSHLIRLSFREWIAAGILLVIVYTFLPRLWNQFEPMEIGPDYRIPYQLSNDYWIFQRYIHLLRESNNTYVIGDSAIWGEYVTPEQTFSHFLNERNGQTHFINAGVNGIHPAALEGLIRYYGQAIQDRDVILHCNPLWMSSPRHDLQMEKEFSFNHPRLVPQIYPRIPCYRASFSERASILAEREISFLNWGRHLQVAYFNNLDFPSWTLEHPYANPLRPINWNPLESSEELRHGQESWTERGIETQEFQWVDLATSFQWSSLKNTIHVLQQRGNHLFVIVGPFNEHMMNEESLRKYQTLKSGMEAWQKEQTIACFVPDVLPSRLYADASHPLKEGYDILAEQVYQDKGFQEWLKNGNNRTRLSLK